MINRSNRVLALLSLLVSILLVIPLLSACQSGVTTITFVFLTSSQDKAEAYWQQVVSDFEAQNPDLGVNLIITNWTDGPPMIAQMVAAGRVPELAKVSTRSLPQYVFAGHAEPIDDYMSPEFREQFYPRLMEEGTQYQGRTFGVPIAYTTRALYYNKDIFAQAGITEAPKTWEDLREAAIKIGQLPSDVAGFGLQGDKKHVETSTYFYYFLWGNGGNALTPDGVRASFNSPEGLEALTFLQTLIEEGGTQSDPTAYNRKALEDAFVRGEIAMVITFNGLAKRLASEAPDMNYGITEIPYNTQPVSLAVTDSLILFKNASHKSEAWRFVEFMYQDKYRLKAFQWEGILPEKRTLEGEAAVADDPTINFFVSLEPFARFEPLNVRSADIASIVADELAQVYLGDKDAATALDDAAARANELLSYSATSW